MTITVTVIIIKNYDDNCSDTIVVTIYGKRIDSLLKKSLHNMQKL